jgi:hypothetical protein
MNVAKSEAGTKRLVEALMVNRTIAIVSTRIFSAAAVLAVSLAVTGCAHQRIAFTQGIRTHYDLGSEELKNLQYYVSSDITLQREFLREEGEISKSHKLVKKEGGLVEQVFIRAGTPGIATEVGDTSLAVSFEPGTSLIFGSSAMDQDPERKYKLTAKRWAGDYGEILYDGKVFYAVEGSGLAYLVVGMESLDVVKEKKKVLPGMTLPSK